MSFRDEVNNTAKSALIEAFIASLFSNPNRRLGDILDDIMENDDPDDDWMRETLFDLEVRHLVKSGMKAMGLASESAAHAAVSHNDDDGNGDGDDGDDDDDDVIVIERDDGTDYILGEDSDGDERGGESEDEDVEPAPPPKKKRKKKKIPRNTPEVTQKKKKKKVTPKAAPKAASTRRSKGGSEEDAQQAGYNKLIVRALRAHKAYDEDTAVNNQVILNEMHGEGAWGDEESAALRGGISTLVTDNKVSKVGKRRGTRYHLN